MSKWKLKVNGKAMDVDVEETASGWYNVKVDGREHRVVVDRADWALSITTVGSAEAARAASPIEVVGIAARARRASAPVKPLRTTKPALPPETPAAMPKLPAAEPPPPVFTGRSVPSPMPGRVIKVIVKSGDEVSAGEGICILESMKMENTIPSPRSGKVTTVHVKEGDSTNTGSPLVDIE